MAIIVVVEKNQEIKDWFKTYFENHFEKNHVFYLDSLEQINDINFNIETPFFINTNLLNEFKINTHYLIRYDFDFKLNKPHFILYIKSHLDKIEDVNLHIKNHLYQSHKIVLNDSKNQIIIPLKEILYIERIKRYSLIKTENRIFQTRTTFAELLPDLDSNFIQCHRSYIVNLQEVREYFRSEFNLNNGEIIPISRNFSKKVELEWQIYTRFFRKSIL